MKKILLLLCITSCLYLFCSCKQIDSVSINCSSGNNCKSELSDNIQNLKDAGLLDNLLCLSRNVSDDESSDILNFINNTDEVLQKIKET